MERVIVALYYIMFFVTLIYGTYFTLSGYIGIMKKSKANIKKAEKFNHFAILVPARNEAKVISNLIESLKSQNYPKDKYDIYVIPNNCTDDTEGVAKKAGAKTIKCTVPTKTKGDVLKFVFEKFSGKKGANIDAYIIFDADNLVHPDFISHMNDALESGYNVAQGFRDAKNPSDNWISGSYALFYLLQNIFFNKARMSLNVAASINGTGFMISKALVEKHGFETYTLTEDVEYSGQCALRGEKIAFVEEAVTYDEYPVSFRQSWTQRRRWSAGNIECMKRYTPNLIKTAIKTKNVHCLDMGLTYMQILGFANMGMLIILSLAGIELNDIFSYMFNYGIAFMLFTYILGLLVEIFALLYKNKKIAPVMSGILLFPVFFFTWIPINITCFIKKQVKWEEIKHERSIAINDVLE